MEPGAISVRYWRMKQTVINYQVMNDLMGGDSTLQVGAASFTKQAPDDAYAYDTVSASSSALKKNLVCNGFVNGWTEFGIIRAYLNDDRLDDNLRNYLIASTRMTYALYGVADISVHAGGWGEAEVTDRSLHNLFWRSRRKQLWF